MQRYYLLFIWPYGIMVVYAQSASFGVEVDADLHLLYFMQ